METQVGPRTIQELEERIKQGDAQSVRRFLKTLNVRKVERASALGLANLCRRVNMVTLGLRILNPILRSEKRAIRPASDLEKAEYAVLLLRVGAVEEAIAILKTLDPRSCPDVSLYLAFCAFTRWDYRNAIPHLRRYVSAGSIPEYQRLVGQVNLAAALVHEEQYAEAKLLLEEIQRASRQAGYLRT